MEKQRCSLSSSTYSLYFLWFIIRDTYFFSLRAGIHCSVYSIFPFIHLGWEIWAYNIRCYSEVLAVCQIEIPLLLKKSTAFYGENVRNILMSLFCKHLIFISMPVENCVMVSYSEYWFSHLQRLRERSRVITLLEGIKNIKCDEKGSV